MQLYEWAQAESREALRFLTIYTSQLLHGLSTGTEEQTTNRLRASFIPRLPAEEFGPGHGIFTFVLDSVDDFFMLSEDEGIVF